MPSANRTTDHETIMQWVDSRGGRPAHVKRTGGGKPGVLRIDFPGFSGEESLEPLDWDTWFDAFEKNSLAFLYQDATAGGEQSRFSKLVRRTKDDEVQGQAPHRRGQRRKGRTTAVDLNTASEDELVALWGIGPVIAGKIVAYRRQHGGIESPDELTSISGIDEVTVENLKSEIGAH